MTTAQQQPKHDADHLIWIDLEMTGLDPNEDSIIEIATVVTNKDLVILARGPEYAIYHAEDRLASMNDWNRDHHQQSGLWQRVLDSQITHAEAEAQTLAFLSQWVGARISPMCGNSICQDRRFLFRQMPQLEAYFHYRNLDVSTIKELARRWAPQIYSNVHKQSQHTAYSDIIESIDELAYYRRHMGLLGGG